MAKIRSFRPKQNFNPNSTPNPVSKMQGQNMQLHTQIKGPAGKVLKLVPLGGVGDVTKNMYVYEWENDIVIIDCGVGFPDEGMLGIDLVIPDISYLRDKKDKIRAILITHAHDDHIGGLAYIWPELNVPIYSQKLTCGLIKAKFTEHNLPKDKIHTVGLNEEIQLGAFSASFYMVSHSIPDSAGIVLRTPVGTIIHQADFKMDWTPVNGQTTDVATVARVSEEGVILMLIDCLRVEKQGYTLSEKTIESTFEKVTRETKGKVLITMTSSNLTRVQQAINVAVRNNRKIVLAGRSVEGNFQVAQELGYLDVPPGLIIAQEQAKRFAPDKLIVIIAGSQGQPGSALSRVANSDHKYLSLAKNDSVVFSADPIPSTESAQYALIDRLTKFGCNVYYSALTSDLHVSGHAAAEELKLMINLAKPKYILPIGGTFRHMKAFSLMAVDMGYKSDQILMAEDGSVILVDQTSARLQGSVPVSNIYVDGLGVGDVGSIVLQDRQVMSGDGIVVVVVPIEGKSGKMIADPEIISRGFIFEKGAEDLIDASREIVKSCLNDSNKSILSDWRYIRHEIENSLEKFFYQEMKRTPLILTIVVES